MKGRDSKLKGMIVLLMLLAVMAFAKGGQEQGPQTAEAAKLVMWWWGDQENPGSAGWVKESIAKYTQLHPNVSVEEMLQSTDSIIPVWRSAVEAKDVPDIQYFWGGIWTLEDVWLGNIAPLSDYWTKDELKNLVAPPEFSGKIWAAPWYTNLMTFVYNKKILKELGVPSNIVQLPWKDFVEVCQKAKSAGYIPYSMGIKDNLWGNWLFAHLAKQNCSTMKEILAPIVGKARFSDPKYSDWLNRMKELIDKGLINDDATSVELYASMDNFTQGKALFTTAVSGTILSWRPKLGEENIGIMLPPKIGTGKYAESIGTGTHGLGIPALAKNRKGAAEFLRYLHTPDRLGAFYAATGALVSDKRFDMSAIKSPLAKDMFAMLAKYPDLQYGNVAPQQLDFEAIEPTLQLLFSNSITVKEGAEKYDATIEKWGKANPVMLKNFTDWYEGS